MSSRLITSLNIRNVCRLIQFSTRRMSSYDVYVTRPDVPEEGMEFLKSKGYNITTWTKQVPVPRAELIKQIKGKHAVLCMLTDKIDAEVLEAAGPSLKVVSTMSVGYEHLDVAEIKKRNILIGYTPGVLTAAVAELTIALLLATSRRLFESHRAILKDQWSAWSPSWMCGPSLKGSTVGVVGFGRIGQAVAQLLAPFGVARLLYTARSDKPEAAALCAVRADLKELLRESDFVICTMAHTPETTNFFNGEVFATMKPTAIFINTSRGALVDQDALLTALQCGTIRAAGLDVMTPEPLPSSHPLLQLNNCVVIPHIGSASYETRAEMAMLAARNIAAALQQETLPAQI